MGMRRRGLMGIVGSAARITIENIKGSWGESSKTVSGYRVYESKGSYNVNNGYDLAKVTFSGHPEFTFLYGSYAESSYDYMRISPLDYSSAQNWTGSSSTGYLLSTSGKQSSSAPNLSHTFTNDGGEHFFYILYRKDSSVNSGNDRGYIAFRQANYLQIDKESVLITHLYQTVTCQITSDLVWKISTSADWISADVVSGAGNKQITLSCLLNSGVQRSGDVVFTSAAGEMTLSITQQAYDFTIPNTVSIKYGDTKIVLVGAELNFTFTNPYSWLLCEQTNGESGKTLTITLLEDVEPQTCGIIVTSGNIAKTLNVRILSDLDYIQEGLIFELDGLDKQGYGEYCWVDKVGGIKFVNVGGAVELENGFSFNGSTSSYLSGDSLVSNAVATTNWTIEIVLNSTVSRGGWSPTVMFSDWSNPSSAYAGLTIRYSSGANNYKHTIALDAKSRDGYIHAYEIPNNSLLALSILSNKPVIANLTYYNTLVTSAMPATASKTTTYIGGRNDGGRVATFTGEIHAVRIYNRLLTEDEIFHNQSIDMLKYNI